MRVFQTIHKYNPHIPWFEEKYGIHDASGHSFNDIQRLLIEDGYASAYILQPALEGKTEEVFFTLWNYERLQKLWAKEHGMQTDNLQEIKRAQIEEYKPDVFYDFSAMLDKDFIQKYAIASSIKKVAWYGIIEKQPELLNDYDLRVTLHRPYLSYWNERKLKAFELQPAFDTRWEQYDKKDKPIDILFYGQFLNRILGYRNDFVTQLLKYASEEKELNIKVHLQLQSPRKVRKKIFGIGIPKIHEKFPSDFVVQHALPPIYGQQLYSTIGQSKFVINGYGNHNVHFKSNMRLFEALGCGSLLISERGNYPEGFLEQMHYIPYDIHRARKTINSLKGIVAQYQTIYQQQHQAIQEVKQRYAKQLQWERFKQQVAL